MKTLNEAKKAAINALKALKQTLATTHQKNAIDDLIAQTELVSDSNPKYFLTMHGDDQAAFEEVERAAGL